MGVYGNVSILIYSIPVAATVDFMVERIGPIAQLQLPVDHLGTILDTIKSTEAATGIEQM